jgi:hypothetical protein
MLLLEDASSLKHVESAKHVHLGAQDGIGAARGNLEASCARKSQERPGAGAGEEEEEETDMQNTPR